jgi:hypothetical protein
MAKKKPRKTQRGNQRTKPKKRNQTKPLWKRILGLVSIPSLVAIVTLYLNFIHPDVTLTVLPNETDLFAPVFTLHNGGDFSVKVGESLYRISVFTSHGNQLAWVPVQGHEHSMPRKGLILREHSVILTFPVAAVGTVQTPDPVCHYTWHIVVRIWDDCSPRTTTHRSA